MTATSLALKIILIAISYVMGSIPFGVWISQSMFGIDPRHAGSGNMGATNVLRVAGKKAALLTLVGDILKGIFPVLLARFFGVEQQTILFIGFFAILGHLFPIFLRFKGGKGVAVSLGVFLGIAPMIALVASMIWLGGVKMGKYSSVGALAAFGALPFIAFFLKPEPEFVLFCFLLSVLVCFRHKDNIFRLIQGEEKSS